MPPSVDRIFLTRTAGSDRVAMTHAAIGVEFSEAVRQPGAQVRFRIVPSVNGSFSWDGDRTMVFTPAEKLPIATTFTVTIRPGYADLAGNVTNSASRPFVFQTVDQPSIVSTVPASGATGVPLNASLSITFDRLMDTQHTAAAVSLQPAARLRASWRGPTLTLVPETPLQPGTDYRLLIGADAVDTDGNTLAGDVTVAFRTLEVGLGVERVLPADGAAGVPLAGPIGIVFAAPVDPTTVIGSITVTPSISGQATVVVLPADPVVAAPTPAPSSVPTGQAGLSPTSTPPASSLPATGPALGTSPPPPSPTPPVPTPTPTAAPMPPSPGTVVVFTPGSPLAPNTTYTVILKAGVVRSLGAGVAAAGRTWSFTTGGPLEALQNQIVYRSARGGVENVWAMNPDGTNARQVSSELAPVSAFDVSSDGKTLVYSAGGIVRRLSLPGGDLATLTDAGSADYAPRLVPGTPTVIVGRRNRSTGADEGWWLLQLDGSRPPQQLLPTGAPPLGSAAAGIGLSTTGAGAWTPPEAVSADGSLALVPDATGNLLLVTMATGAAADTGLQGAVGPPAWSSHDDGFVVVAQQAGITGTWIVSPPNAAGGGPSVVPGPPLAAWPAVAPDGALVGVGTQPPDHLAFRAALDEPPTILTAAPDLLDRQPAFGPSADAIVFVRVRTVAPTVSTGIWVVDSDGRELRQLTTDGSDPRWLP